MGQPVTVIEKPSSTPGVIRYETNRTLTGMDHEIFRSADEAVGERPIDVLAQRLFERGGIRTVSANSNVITVTLLDASPPAGIKEIIEDLYTYYRPGVEVVIPEGAGTDWPLRLQDRGGRGKVPRAQVADAMRSLLAFKPIVTVDPALLLRAIEVYEIERLDFAEASLVACAETTGINQVASFDQAIDRVSTVERIERPTPST